MQITGTTKLYGLMGDPLAKAKSPGLLNKLFLEQAADAVCIPFEVGAGGIAEFVAGARALKNLSGLLVTMPHKQAILQYVDELHPTAREVGAVNVIRCTSEGRWIGAIFDGLGFVQGMQWDGHSAKDKSVLIVGAGGAGRAIAFAIAHAGARSLTIHDRTRSRAEELAQEVSHATNCQCQFGAPDPFGFELVINATSLGMKSSDALPVDPSRLTPGSSVVDIINSPEPTQLYLRALERGCHVQDGRPMHEGQAVHALRFLGFDYLPEGRSFVSGLV